MFVRTVIPQFSVPGKCPSCNREITVSLKTRADQQRGPAPNSQDASAVDSMNSILREVSDGTTLHCNIRYPVAFASSHRRWLFHAIEDGYTTVSWCVGAILVMINVAAVITFLRARKMAPLKYNLTSYGVFTDVVLAIR